MDGPGKVYGSYFLRLVLVATLGGLLFGYDTAVINGAIGALESYFIQPLSESHELAVRVIWEYKIMAGLCFAAIAILVGSFLIRLYGILRGGLAGLLLLAVTGWLVNVRLLSQPDFLSETMANSISGFAIASALLGCVIGGSLGGFVSLSLGRRNGLILAAVLFLVSAYGSAFPEKMNIFGVQTISSFITFRVIGGVGVGIASMLSPMYIAEIAPASVRGRFVSLNQFAIILGMLLVYFINYFIARGQEAEWLNQVGWRWMFASELIPATLFFILLLTVPETPRYLVIKNKDDEALSLLSGLSGKDKAGQILADIKKTLTQKSAPWLAFGGRVIVIGILLSVFQQFVGINVVLYYASRIFSNMGNDTDTSLLQTIIVGSVNLVFTILAIFTVDRFGRKPLQITGALGMAVSMTGLGFCFYFQKMGGEALFFMLLYTAFFAMSWGPVTWVLLSEIFPNSIRGALSIAVAAQWVANLAVSWTFPILDGNSWLSSQFHKGFAYWLYGVMGVLAAVFVWKLVPETRGKSLEEMELLWHRKKSVSSSEDTT